VYISPSSDEQEQPEDIPIYSYNLPDLSCAN
jgi:hypothetical protein